MSISRHSGILLPIMGGKKHSRIAMGVFGCVGYATYIIIVVWLQPLNLETPENRFLTRVSIPQPYQSAKQTVVSVLSQDQGLGSKHLLHRYLYFHVLRHITECFSPSFPDLRNWNRHIIKVIWSTLNSMKTSDSYQTQPCLTQVGFKNCQPYSCKQMSYLFCVCFLI